MILVIDNYDSFVENLARYVRRLGPDTVVVRNDQLSVAEIHDLQPEAILISPGPCSPDEAGICLELVRELHTSVPILGICLGHQAIIQALGGTISRAPTPVHGRSSQVEHQGDALFASIPSPFNAARYHSLIGSRDEIPEVLDIVATTEDKTVMAVRHTSRPVVGLQFHPESILTECGYQVLDNFLAIAGCPSRIEAVDLPVLQQQEIDNPLQNSLRPYAPSPRLSIQELP